MFKVSSDIQKKLLSLPESGMGYQIVEAVYRDYSSKECIILNASIAEPINNRSAQEVLKSITLEEANRVEKLSTASTDIIDVRLKADKGIFKASVVKLSEAKGADKNPEESTRKDEHFVRFARFEDDNRIDKITKKVRPGTYATTFEDAKYCISNKIDPIERYALPGPLKVKFAFHIRPLEKTPIKRGTVEPAYNQLGGGAEVLFTKGTDHNTVSLPPETL